MNIQIIDNKSPLKYPLLSLFLPVKNPKISISIAPIIIVIILFVLKFKILNIVSSRGIKTIELKNIIIGLIYLKKVFIRSPNKYYS